MQRKLTTILAADVAGYSRLASVDEEGTVSRLRALRHEVVDPVVTANGGRIFKETGDGRLAEFTSRRYSLCLGCSMRYGGAERQC